MRKTFIVLAILVALVVVLLSGMWVKDHWNLQQSKTDNGEVATTAAAATGRLDQWYLRGPLPTNNPLAGVAYGNGIFVAVGGEEELSGAILSSSDGITWTSRSLGNSGYLSGICYGNGAFVAVGDNGTVLTSSDGVNWTSCTSGTANNLNGVCYDNNNSTFIAAGNNGTILQSRAL
jgi:hypothetical protein